MVKKVLQSCFLFLVLILTLTACGTSTTNSTTQISASNNITSPLTTSVLSTNSTTSIPGYFNAVLVANQNSTSVDIHLAISNNKVTLPSSDPRFAEVINFLSNSVLKRIINKSVVTTGNGVPTTLQCTVPYASKYIITFKLKNDSVIRFNCAVDSTWFETDEEIYEASFSKEFDSFLETLVSHGNITETTLSSTTASSNPDTTSTTYHGTTTITGTKPPFTTSTVVTMTTPTWSPTTTVTVNTCVPTETTTVLRTATTTVVIPPSTITVNTCIPTETVTIMSVTTLTTRPPVVTVTVTTTR